MFRPISAQLPGNHPDEIRGRNHADLDGIGPDILEDGIEFCSQEAGSRFLHHAHPRRILRRECRDGTHTVNAVSQHGLEIRLDSCATAGVTAGNGQYFFHPMFSFSLFSLSMYSRLAVSPAFSC